MTDDEYRRWKEADLELVCERHYVGPRLSSSFFSQEALERSVLDREDYCDIDQAQDDRPHLAFVAIRTNNVDAAEEVLHWRNIVQTHSLPDWPRQRLNRIRVLLMWR